MVNHSSATTREPHTLKLNNTISNSLRRRAESVINDKSIDAESRALIRYGLEIDDPWLAELVRRADAGESIVDNLKDLQTSADDSSDEKIEVLAEMICRADEESAAALLVLMATIENASHPKALANAAKHFAFLYCGEFNVYGMVDTQIALLEAELLAG